MAGRPPPPSLATTLADAAAADGDAGRRAGRRRPRASRRAPVTVLNTDTANFQAMVQQFTGIPARPFPHSGGEPFISFAPGGFSDPNMIQIQHRTQPVPHHRHQYPETSIVGGGGEGGHSEAFLRALSNSSMSLEMAADGFLLDSMPGEGVYYHS